MLVACRQEPVVPSNKPDVPTLSVEAGSVTRVSMKVNGSFGQDMANITEYGVEISDALFEEGGTYRTLVPTEVGPEGFALLITDLSSNMTYYIRAFIGNGHSRLYSATVSQNTPETSVASVSDVRFQGNSTLVATIEDDGGRAIEDVGFIWSTSSDISDICHEKRHPATLESGSKTFSLPIGEMGQGTYYVLAYVEDERSSTGYSANPVQISRQ